MREFEDRVHIPTEYASLDEAFLALPEFVQKHSIRVAEYIQVLFAAAISVEMNLGDSETVIRRQKQNNEGIYWSGYFHEIGLLALPEDCRLSGQCVTEEQLAIHRLHVQTGIDMVRHYGIEKDNFDEFEYQMVLEAIRYHHERWDGTGYPEGLSGKQIPMTALLLACADSLDNEISHMISERAFEDAVRNLLTDESLDTEVRLVLKYSTSGLRKVFKRHRGEYQLITPPENFVVRRRKRRMKLMYQSHPCLEDLSKTALSAKPYFFDNKGTEMDFTMLESYFGEKGETGHLCRYFLYEAADMLNRVNAYPFDIAYLSLYMFPAFMELENLQELIGEMLKDTGADRKQLAFAIAKGEKDRRTQAFENNLKLLQDTGFTVQSINTADYEDMTLREQDVDANEMIRILTEELMDEA